MADAMVEVATCPTCLLVRVGERLLQCQAGHLTCCPCYNLLASRPRRCPTANCPFDAPPRRQLAVEDWAGRTATPLPCRWEVEGCDTLLTREEREGHQADCPFRGASEPQQPAVEVEAVAQPHGTPLPGLWRFLEDVCDIILALISLAAGVSAAIATDLLLQPLLLCYLLANHPPLF